MRATRQGCWIEAAGASRYARVVHVYRFWGACVPFGLASLRIKAIACQAEHGQFQIFELFGHFVDNRLLIGISPYRYSGNFTCAIFSFT